MVQGQQLLRLLHNAGISDAKQLSIVKTYILTAIFQQTAAPMHHCSNSQHHMKRLTFHSFCICIKFCSCNVIGYTQLLFWWQSLQEARQRLLWQLIEVPQTALELQHINSTQRSNVSASFMHHNTTSTIAAKLAALAAHLSESLAVDIITVVKDANHRVGSDVMLLLQHFKRPDVFSEERLRATVASARCVGECPIIRTFGGQPCVDMG
jgi:hypothetical protein